MAGVNALNVLTGAPDQQTTGAILSGPAGTPLPDGVSDQLDPALASSGYISEDGLTLTPERSSEPIRDWSGAVVRQILTEFGATLGWSHLETNEESLRNYFGDDNVTVQAATATEAKRITALLRGSEMPRKSWVFRIKDGDARVVMVVPDGQITESGEVSFVKSGAILWPVVLTTYPDADGVNVYVHLDDGRVLVAGVPVVAGVTPDGAGEGELVTITGTRLSSATAVTVDGFEAEFTQSGDALIVAMPAGAAGDVAVVVTNVTGSSQPFTYTRG